MIRVCATLDLGGDASAISETAESLASAPRAAHEIERSHVAPHLEGSLGAGDLVWDFGVSGSAALAALTASAAGSSRSLLGRVAPGAPSEIAKLEAWIVEPIADAVCAPEAAAIKRTNLVRIRAGTPLAEVTRWAEVVCGLAHAVPAIRNWSLSRLRPLFPEETPRVSWTHAWEQEFETLAGLSEDYMASAYHWGVVDGWYDPEVPGSVVEPDLAHLFGEASESVLGWCHT